MIRNMVFGLFFLFLTVTIPAWGNKEKGTPVEITGIVRLVGSSPINELVITGPEGEWYIEKDEEHKLKDLQYQIVTVQGMETVIQLTFVNGMSAGERRTLKKIKIITP